jgi:hypothetical protein
MDPVSELVERLHELGTSKPKFKAPKFSGETDVELFITQFLDISDANRWSEREGALHLRTSLEGPAANCGHSADLEEIIQDLRSRFGITAKQARLQLSQIQKKPKQSFHELGMEVTRLVKLAYPDQGRAFQTETALENFSRAVNHKSPQHHLLARPHDTIVEAITICNEYSQIEGGKTSIAAIETPEPTRDTTTTQLQSMLSAMQELIHNQSKALAELAKNQSQKKKIECFECKGPHLKRNCPLLKKQSQESNLQISGNEVSPAQ